MYVSIIRQQYTRVQEQIEVNIMFSTITTPYHIKSVLQFKYRTWQNVAQFKKKLSPDLWQQ